MKDSNAVWLIGFSSLHIGECLASEAKVWVVIKGLHWLGNVECEYAY